MTAESQDSGPEQASAGEQQRTASDEPNLEPLLRDSLAAAIATAQAQRGALLMANEQGDLILRAVTNADSSKALSQEYPASLVEHCRRTGGPVLPGTSGAEHLVRSDPYLSAHKPRSAVVMPLLNRGQLKGVLYLEHSSEPDLFTPGRLQIIEALGTQMAVSLEIALIHENLEDLACRREAQLAEAQQAVESATKVKSAFLASMSHELRTPLNAIMGYSELLKDELEDEGMEDFTPDLEKIRWAGKHLVTLINDIMDLSNLEAGSMELLLQPFSVSNLLDEVRAAIMPLVERSGNALNIEVEQGLGEVLADQTRVKQIIFILLSNACKFTDQGSITLRMRQEQDCLLFSVSDTGIGITREQQALIYEPFKQADATTTKKHDGAGLGLALAKYLTEMMHGSIMVESEAGQGTTFEVRLPVLIDQQDARAEPDTAEGPPDEPKRAAAGTILVIDDDAAVRGIMQRMLTQDGFVVHCAEDGEQGLRMARQLRPSAITLDMMMPGMDGWSVMTALKTDPLTAEIPVVMVSIEDGEHRRFALGVSDFLVKPFDRPRLIKVLHRQLGSGSSGKVLIIDDDQQNREMLDRIIRKEGFEVMQAVNGRQGLEQVQADPPRLILLDLMMPEMNGFEFLAELRHRESSYEIPVVVLTAKDLGPKVRAQFSEVAEAILEQGTRTGEEMQMVVRRLLVRAMGAQSNVMNQT